MTENTNCDSTPTIAVVGGGITGLSAAYRLVERANQTGRSVRVKLFEAASTLGGTIHTERREGFLLEHGPDSFITQKPGGLDLCKRLNLTDHLIGTEKQFRRSFVVRAGKLHPLPEGFMLLAPTQFWPLITSRLFSLPGKLRMGLDLILPRGGNADGDETLASFVTRRLGKEALDWAAQPLVGGIYTADPANLSLKTTLPRFLEMETRHRSVIKAMWKQRAAARQEESGDPDSIGIRYSMFVTIDDGLRSLIEALEAQLPDGIVSLNSSVRQALWDETDRAWKLAIDKDSSLKDSSLSVQGLIVGLPSYAAADVLRDQDAALADELAAIEYASSGTINLAYRQEDVGHPLDGFGFVVPAVENRSILACTFCHRKFAGRVPAGHVLLRAFVGGAMCPEQLDRSDHEMVAAARKDLAELLGIHAEPILVDVWRHDRSMPQYSLGHLDRVARIEKRMGNHPRLRIAGNCLGGVGIPDCATSATQAADALFDELTR